MVDHGQPLEYVDFELLVSQNELGANRVSVIRSPAGELAHDVLLRLPFTGVEMEARLRDLPAALIRSSYPGRSDSSAGEKAIRSFGRQLFTALLGGEIGALYRASRLEAERQGRGLRLKLRVRPPHLAAVPWELMFDPFENDYICLSRHMPMIRYLEIDRPVRPLRLTPPLRMLGMAVSPRRMVQIDALEEKRLLEEALDELRVRRLLELVWWEGQTFGDLQAAMRVGPWHVFHFIGHGAFRRDAGEGALILADEAGFPFFLPASDLARLLVDQRSLRLVVLNACYTAQSGTDSLFSSTAGALLQHGLAAVIAMQYPLSDLSAIHFSRELYRSIAGWLPVDAAVAEGRKAIRMRVPGSLEWAVPVLLFACLMESYIYQSAKQTASRCATFSQIIFHPEL